MNLRSLEQERAAYAYECVKEVKEEDEKTQGRYAAYVKSAPVLILTNGLGQTLAFYLAKIGKNIDEVDYKSIDPKSIEGGGDKKAYAYLYKHIARWLAEDIGCHKSLTNGTDPLKYIISQNSTSLDVMLLTEEALFLLNWLKRFADAMLKKDKDSGE
ncbi:type III-B CRISPR module-associated protein Cmr5 [Pyrococcus yayanosii]|uniref:CRISPR type III-B/RAMP module-associated protein Cmr5 n=1 Tax=Pyrococcus yayanosii (strain CH1 / JCM 16557) TaxID=529709 RepID=F8AJ06_PYRYC|nr:type III-B CRISPR module-associated protein Cmr5 [Pyrococcus yayanosii]AEH24489.1 CRISPR-associated protein, Cmr5 family [Pyrococcus yayanosii CH1]